MTREQAQITLQQLAGGNGSGRLKAMIGAKDFTFSGDEHFVAFKFKSCRKANYVKITLNAMDLYDIEFGKIKKFEYDVVKEFVGVYDDMLTDIFEDFTGLRLSL